MGLGSLVYHGQRLRRAPDQVIDGDAPVGRTLPKPIDPDLSCWGFPPQIDRCCAIESRLRRDAPAAFVSADHVACHQA